LALEVELRGERDAMDVTSMTDKPAPAPPAAHPTALPGDLLFSMRLQPTATSLVTLKVDGSVEFGPDYSPDASARAFWEGLAARNPLLGRVERAEVEVARLLTSEIDLRAQLAAATDALAACRAERDALLTVVKEIDSFGEGLIRREYEPGSRTVRELVEKASALTRATRPAAPEEAT
jgi:hypothetical protein